MVCRDQIIAKVLDVFVGPIVGSNCGEVYIEAVAKADEIVRNAAEELGG